MSDEIAPDEPAASGTLGIGIARAAVLIATVTILARLTAFARVVVFARTVGPSCLGDTYFTANTVPNIVFDVVAGGALSSLVVPVIAGPAAAGDRAAVNRTASALLTWAATLLVPIMLVGLAFTHPLMRLLVGGGHPGCASADEVAVGARMLAVFMPQVVLYGFAVVLIGVLQGHRRFLGPATGPLVSSLVVIATCGVFAAVATRGETGLTTLTRGHELILSVGTTIGVASLIVPMLFPAARIRLRVRPTYRFPPGVASRVRAMAISGALVLGSQDIATAVVLRLANARGTEGSVVLYNLAWTAFTVPWAVAAVPLATSAFPGLTSSWQDGARAAYAATVARTSRVLLVVVAGAAGILVAASTPIADVIVLGAPGDAPPQVLSRALVTFAPGLLGYGLVALMSRALYAQGNARTPATAAIAGWLVAIGADIVLTEVLPRSWTVGAVGLGTTLGVTVSAVLMLIAMHRSAGTAALNGLRRATVAALAGGGCAAGVGWLLSRAFHSHRVVSDIAVAVLVGVVALVVHTAVTATADRATVGVLLRRAGLRRG